MKKIYFVFLFLFLLGCEDSILESNSDTTLDFSEIVKTDDDGIIISDFEEQWQPRISLEESSDTNSVEEVPEIFAVYPPYPNPFEDDAILRYQMPKNAEIEITVKHEDQNRKKTYVKERKSAGNHHLIFSELDSGYHKIQISAGDWETYGFIYKEE